MRKYCSVVQIMGAVMDEAVNFVSILFADNRGLSLFAILLGYGLVMMGNLQLNAGTLEVESKRTLP